MQIKPMGHSGIMVPDLCLGTMTFGTQTSADDAFAQMDMAVDAGINFFDTAEMYPVNPIGPETQGASEQIVGDWLENRGRRSDVIIATKQAGEGVGHIRAGAAISPDTIPQAIEGSLRRLKTDHIDLYQFHWPNRGSYMFRQNWDYDPSHQNKAETLQHMADALGALQTQVDRGVIRAFGLSNESAWGTAQWLRLAEDGGGPRVATLQNEYSLMCRMYDTDLAELSMNEDVGLLAFSPLAAGYLTGKYQSGATPKGSRLELQPTMGGRLTPRTLPIVQAYLDVFAKYGVDPIHGALAWCRARPFMCSAIFGATNVGQLSHIIAGRDVTLSADCMNDLNATHRANPMPY